MNDTVSQIFFLKKNLYTILQLYIKWVIVHVYYVPYLPKFLIWI